MVRLVIVFAISPNSESRYDEEFYRTNIRQPLTEERIIKWFNWKNGRALSAKKAQTIRRYGTPAEQIASDADTDTLTAFLNRPGGAIWRIFWLHLQHPDHFPIYDQHVHRAVVFLLKLPNTKMPVDNPTKVSTYLHVYRPFFDGFMECERRNVDRALWTFGRFLASDYGRMVTD